MQEGGAFKPTLYFAAFFFRILQVYIAIILFLGTEELFHHIDILPLIP